MKLRWHLAALLISVCALGYFAQQWLAESRRASAQLAAWQQEEQLEAALDQQVEIRLGQRVSLQAWLDEFTQQSGIPVRLNDPEKQLPTDFQPNLDLSRRPASSALDALARRIDFNWSAERDGTVGLYALPPFPRPFLRNYALRPTVPPHLQRLIAETIQSTIEPDSWERVGGQGALIEAPNLLIVSQHSYVHRRLRPFLDSLQAQLANATKIEPAGLSPDDPRLKPVMLSAGASNIAKLSAALETEISIDAVEKPLKDVIAEIAEKMHLTIIMSKQLEAEGVNGDEPVTLQVSDLRASTILRLVLDQVGARVVPSIGDNMLRVVTHDQAHTIDNLVTMAYPVPDFGLSEDQLVQLITWAIEPDSWEDVGGPGTIRVLDKLLVVTQAEHQHARNSALLKALRTVRRGQQRWASAEPPSPGRDQTLKFLSEPLALEYDERTLREVIGDISHRSGLVIRLMKTIEDAGVTADTRITCALPIRPLERNLRLLLAPHHLTFLVQDETLAIVSQEDAYSPDHLELAVLDARPFLAGRGCSPGALHELLIAAVETDSWVDVGGPGFIEEFQGLLVVGQRPELLAQVRHVCAAVEHQFMASPPARNRGNLLTRKPADGHPNDPLIHLYDVDDLLAPRGGLTPLQLIQSIRDVTVSDGAQESYLLEMQIHLNRFVVIYLGANQVMPFEENLRKLRAQQP